MGVNVIGGADGPTAIYLASTGNWVLVVALGVAALGAALFFLLRKRKNC